MPAIRTGELPQSVQVGWTDVRQLDPMGRVSGDPLGFRAAAARWAGRLVPVFTRSCCRVRQLSVFSLALQVSSSAAGGGSAARERFLRLERLWVLAYHRDRESTSDRSAVFAGVQSAEARLRGDGPLDIATPLLATQLSSGLWGQCRRPAYQLGLIRGRGGGPEGWTLSQRGLQLAAAARMALEPAASLGHAVRSDTISRERLDELFPVASVAAPTDSEEAAWIGDAMWWHDQLPGNNGEFRSLSVSLEAFGALATDMPDDQLTPDQAWALEVVGAIARLASEVEAPFRQHLCGEDVALALGVGRMREWAVLAEAGERELADLGQRLRDNPSIRVVQTHHERLAASRGAPTWTRQALESDAIEVRQFEPVETRLEAIQALLEDGAIPEGP